MDYKEFKEYVEDNNISARDTVRVVIKNRKYTGPLVMIGMDDDTEQGELWLQSGSGTKKVNTEQISSIEKI